MTPEDLQNRFTYHPPLSDAQVVKYQRIRALGLDFARFVVAGCPESREQSLAVSHIEEAVMWANAAIARHEEVAPPSADLLHRGWD